MGFEPLWATATSLRTLHPARLLGEEALPTAREISSDLLLLTPESAPTESCVTIISCLLLPSELFSHFNEKEPLTVNLEQISLGGGG